MATAYKARIVAALKASPSHVVKIKVPEGATWADGKTKVNKCKLHLDAKGRLEVVPADYAVPRVLADYLAAEYDFVMVANKATRAARIAASK